MKDELAEYIAKAYEKDADAQLKDVYVTNHEARDKKF
jgi:hypothetical protein